MRMKDGRAREREDGSWSMWPATREGAYQERARMYQDMSHRCPVHDGPTGIARYTISNVEFCCAEAIAIECHLSARQEGRPYSIATARAAGATEYQPDHCHANCGHSGPVTLLGECVECKQILSPRQEAKISGLTWYQPAPGDNCKFGHNAPRRVNNGICQQCEALTALGL